MSSFKIWLEIIMLILIIDLVAHFITSSLNLFYNERQNKNISLKVQALKSTWNLFLLHFSSALWKICFSN